MYLSRIALSNVRSMASLAIDFGAGPDAPAGTNRRWTLLLGENGCGKSTVLRAIGLLLAGSEALPELLGDADAWIRNGARQCRIAGTLVTAKGEPREIALELHRGDGLRQIFERNAQTLEALDAAIRHADRNYFVLGYGVSRRPPLPIFSGLATLGKILTRNILWTLFLACADYLHCNSRAAARGFSLLEF